ncbi:MAG: patatin-like phospholipase family protein [Steroidobacteraceae bacterium]|jgi:NTE family protein
MTVTLTPLAQALRTALRGAWARSLRATCVIGLYFMAGIVQAAVAATDASRAPVASEALTHAADAPRIGLVLSGGGARGAAHVGVLKVLEEARIPIHAIAGTSMGALIGGLYASGMSAEKIETLLSSQEWLEAFREPAPRDRLSFRRKIEDQNFLVDFPLGLKGGSFRLPKGLVSGQRLNQLLRRATFDIATIKNFDDLPTRFRAVATDLETGDAVTLASGDLVAAMRASLSAPGVFAPVEIDGKLLVDGGLANNLPVDVARSMDVDVLIVVDVGFPLRTRETLDSVTTISNQMLAILIRRGSDAQRRTLQSDDILLLPDLGEASSFDFDIQSMASERGESAARNALARLIPLQRTEEDYARYRASREQGVIQPTLAEVRVKKDSERYQRLLTADKSLTLSAEDLDQAVTLLYGRGNFESVDYTLQSTSERLVDLEWAAKRNSWGPNYVRFGLNLEDDFSGNSSYNAAARFVLADISDLGGEWVWDLQVGSEPRIASEIYWPMGDRGAWFLLPNASLQLRNIPLLEQGEPVAEYRLRTGEYGLDLGREFGNVAELRFGLRRVTGSTRLRIGAATTPVAEDFDVREYFGRFSYDRLDDRNFPREGGYFTAEWRAEHPSLGSGQRADRVNLDGLIARSWGRHTGVLWSSFGTQVDGDPANVRDLYTLGGFLNLSGLARDSISARHYAITRLLYYRQIGRGGEGFLNVPAYAGLSFEVGNVWQDRSDISLGSALKQGSLFFGFDTLFGPVYLGSGFGESGDTAFYLFLGRTF